MSYGTYIIGRKDFHFDMFLFLSNITTSQYMAYNINFQFTNEDTYRIFCSMSSHYHGEYIINNNCNMKFALLTVEIIRNIHKEYLEEIGRMHYIKTINDILKIHKLAKASEETTKIAISNFIMYNTNFKFNKKDIPLNEYINDIYDRINAEHITVNYNMQTINYINIRILKIFFD